MTSKPESTRTDSLDRFIFEDKDIRACVTGLSHSFVENSSHQNYPAEIQVLLGEFMVASTLLSSSLKFEGRLVLQLRSANEISLIMAECNHQGDVRAYAQYQEEWFANKENQFSFEDFKGATLAITIEPDIGEAYQGIVPLEGKNVGECLQAYFVQSEQLQSYFFLFCDGESAKGFMLQQLPAQLIKDNETRELHWESLKILAATLSSQELLSLSSEELMHRLFHEEQVRLLEQSPVQFSCSCSKARMDKALISIGIEELDGVLLEQGQIDISCEFCKKAYVYGQDEINELFEGSDIPKVIH